MVSSLVSNLSTCTIYRNTKVCNRHAKLQIISSHCALYEHLRVRCERTDDTVDAKSGESSPEKVVLVLMVLEVYVIGAKRIV